SPAASDALPFGHIKTYMVNRQRLAVFFGQIFDRNHVSSFCNSAKSRPQSSRGGKYVCAKAGAVKLCRYYARLGSELQGASSSDELLFTTEGTEITETDEEFNP